MGIECYREILDLKPCFWGLYHYMSVCINYSLGNCGRAKKENILGVNMHVFI